MMARCSAVATAKAPWIAVFGMATPSQARRQHGPHQDRGNGPFKRPDALPERRDDTETSPTTTGFLMVFLYLLMLYLLGFAFLAGFLTAATACRPQPQAVRNTRWSKFKTWLTEC